MNENLIIDNNEVVAFKLPEHVAIPEGVTSIRNEAFYYCNKLTSITIPNSVTSIGEDAFNWCSRLESITIPDSVTSIGDWAFFNLAGLTSIRLPKKFHSIEERKRIGLHVYRGYCPAEPIRIYE